MNIKQSSQDGGKEKMSLHAFRMPDSLWAQAVKKANGLMPVSAVVRRLLEMWVNGEVEISGKK